MSKVDSKATAKATEAGMRRRIYSRGTPEGELQAAERNCHIVDQQFYMLIYDIPTIHNDEVPNPSWLLWKYGFRLNLSCWVLPESSMKRQVIKNLRNYWDAQPTKFEKIKGRMKAQRVKHYVIPYAESARADIMAIAQEKLMEEIDRANEALQDRMAAAEKRYKDAEKALEARAVKYGRKLTATEVDGIEYQKRLNCQAALRDAKQALDSCMECVCLFEMGECKEIKQLIEALQSGIKANEATIKAMVAANS